MRLVHMAAGVALWAAGLFDRLCCYPELKPDMSFFSTERCHVRVSVSRHVVVELIGQYGDSARNFVHAAKPLVPRCIRRHGRRARSRGFHRVSHSVRLVY